MMDHLTAESPPAYVSHDPDDLKLPSVPRQDLRSARNDIVLPNLQTVLASLPLDLPHNPLAARQDRHFRDLSSHVHSPTTTDHGSHSTVMSPSDTASVMSLDDHRHRSTSVVSLDDPAVRLAAEALSGLGSATNNTTHDHQQEPLLNLLVDAHPWVGGTINGSLSAYTTTKNYSPRFVQYGANLIERNIGTPVAHTVSTVGRRTGVESGLRRYLDSRRPSDLETSDLLRQSGKRRRFDTSLDSDCAIDDSFTQPHHEYLPAYRSSKPPSYREERPQLAMTTPRHSHSWSTQLIISTSGLGVALSESSLQSLTYCVRLLSKATEHVEVTMHALRTVLHEFDQTQEEQQHDQARRAKEVESGLMSASDASKQHRANKLAERIKHLCDEIWNTIKTVVNSVSTYAGGALPENARKLVKGQLLSIPQRWSLASQTAAKQNIHQQQNDSSSSIAQAAGGSAHIAAHRMIAFAEQGLDMMAQVSDVVNITLKSAEEWLQSLGRHHKKQTDQDMTDVDAS